MGNQKSKDVREFILSCLTFKYYPVPGWDEYEIRIYWKGKFLNSVRVDGLELACWCFGGGSSGKNEMGYKVKALDKIWKKITILIK